MTAGELLRANGDLHDSPLLATARRLHGIFDALGLPYAIIGGLAVVRNGAPRTTMDVDVLTTRTAWEELGRADRGPFTPSAPDAWRDGRNGVEVDFLFAGDDWGMAIAMPDPDDVSEWDAALGARFIGLPGLLELKTAVSMQKTRDEGPEIAAKDLADVVALLRANRDRIRGDALARCHPGVREEILRIARIIAAERTDRGPKRRPGKE